MGDVIALPTAKTNEEEWTVEEALERTLEAVRSGALIANKVYIALCHKEPGDPKVTMNYAIAGMEIPETLGWLDLHMAFLRSDEG